MLKIGLLIIGNEILDGKINDANLRQLSLYLRQHHLELSTSIIVKDEFNSIHQGLEVLLQNCNIIVTSGGLGPTKDDMTKDALAAYLNRQIIYSAEACAIAEANYQRFQRKFPGKDHGYCYLPEGFLALNNSTGFAPCLFTEHSGKFIICGPGVPREFKSLLEDHFVQLLKGHIKFPEVNIENITIRTKWIPEEKIFNEVDVELWNKLEKFGPVSSLPTLLGVDIGVKIKAANKDQLEEKRMEIISLFNKSPIQPNIWQVGSLSLEEYIVKLANQKETTYGFAESCTGGLCSHRITNVSGSSKTFLGSIVSYAESVKEAQLDVDHQILKQFGAVSTQTAEAMARGIRHHLKTDIAISITGLAGPGGGNEKLPVGTVCIGIANRSGEHSKTFNFHGDREQLKLRFSQAALLLLLEEVEKYS